jgi:hypothetical protein
MIKSFKDYILEQKESKLKKYGKSTVATAMLFNALSGTGIQDKINTMYKLKFGSPQEKFYHMTKNLPKTKNLETGRFVLDTDKLSDDQFKNLEKIIKQMNTNNNQT